MSETSAERAELAGAVERLHGAAATWESTEAVTETHGDRVVWDGEVEVYRLDGHPQAQRAYAWVEPPAQPGGKPRTFAVLAVGPIKTAADAVRASIVQRERERRGA